MKSPILSFAILIGCIFSLGVLHAERATPPPGHDCLANESLCNCGCDDSQGCYCTQDASNVLSQARYGASVGGKVAPDGKTELQTDLPGSLHRKNVASPPGSNNGCCTHTSVHHCSLWQNVPALQEFPKWVQAKRLPGGTYPGEMDKRIAMICKDRGVPVPDYVQLQGGRELLDILRAALAGGRMIGVTYSFSPTGRYGGQKISHMVNLVHLDSSYAAVLDNNYIAPLEQAYEWLTVDEFVRTFTGGRAGWAIILLAAPPPPLPFN
jgi:hypothetical protein